MQPRLRKLAGLIAGEQATDGSFLTLSAPLGNPLGAGGQQYRTTFATSLICSMVAASQEPALAIVLARASNFIQRQQRPGGSFNYWARDSDQAKVKPYPDDWDDTAMALGALKLLSPDALSGTTLAQSIQLLTACEHEVGGPYNTWLVPIEDATWRDVDLAVNCNIGWFLSLEGVELDSLRELLESALRAGPIRSTYYPDELSVIYFASRWYRGKKRDQLRQLAARLGSAATSTIGLALSISAQINFGATADQLGAFIFKLAQIVDTGVEAEQLWVDPVRDGTAYGAGSKAVTAAACLEALTLFQALRGEFEQEISLQRHDTDFAQVRDLLEHEFATWPSVARGRAVAAWQRAISADPVRQITLLPYYFRDAIGPLGNGVSDVRVAQLARMSVLGWMAYGLYDDFLDNEGDPVWLPIANLAFRRLISTIAGDVGGERFSRYAWHVIDTMEAANSWEVLCCRVSSQDQLLDCRPPDYGDLMQLANRSLGHMIGCAAICKDIGVSYDSPAFDAFETFFTHFLIARQLSDEAHDWKEDLAKGHINAVGAALLAKRPVGISNVKELYRWAEAQFWNEEILRVCDLIEDQCRFSQAALGLCSFISDVAPLVQLLAPIKRAVAEARSQQRRTLEFLREYDQATHPRAGKEKTA